MPRRKITTRACGCLVLGLVTTWAVAWAAGLRGYQSSGSFDLELYSPGGDEARPIVARKEAWLAGRLRRMVRAARPSDLNRLLGTGTPITERPLAEVGYGWAMDYDQLVAYFERRQSINVAEYLYGWPFPALWLVSDATSPIYPNRVGGIPLPKSWNPPLTRSTTARALPYSPVWRGLLADTGFYAALWAVLLIGFPGLRQRRRVRKGRCPACAYDLKGNLADGCPECGWKRTENAPASA